MRRFAIGWFALLTLCAVCGAQTLHRQWGQAYKTFQLNGRTLTGHQRRSNEFGAEDSDFTVDISALDLDSTRLDAPGGYFVFVCKANSPCVHYSSHRCSPDPCIAPDQFTDVDTPTYLIDDDTSHQECEAFLKAVRAAAGPLQSAPPPEKEPGIDGSRIPNQIDFRKNQAATTPPVTATGSGKPAFEPLSSLFGPEDSVSEKQTVGGTEKLGSFLDSDTTQEQPLRLSPAEEHVAAGLFDEARKGTLQSAGDALRYAAGEWLTDQYSQLAQNTASYSFTGKSFDELPEDFQKDYAVWDAGLKRILAPFSLKAGLKLVDAFGSLFDLWGEQ